VTIIHNLYIVNVVFDFCEKILYSLHVSAALKKFSAQAGFPAPWM